MATQLVKSPHKKRDNPNEYDPERIPANIDIAENHGLAGTIYLKRKTDPKAKCPCCGIQYIYPSVIPQGETKLDFKGSYKQLNAIDLGCGYSMYFLFMRLAWGMFFIIFVISGIHNISTSKRDNDCAIPNDFCVASNVGQYTLANKRSHEDDLKTQYVLNLITVIALNFYFQYIRYQIRKEGVEADDANITPSDYTIRLANVPGITKDVEIRRIIEETPLRKRTKKGEEAKVFYPKIQSMIRAYDIREYIRLVKEKTVLEKELERIDEDTEDSLELKRRKNLKRKVKNMGDEIKDLLHDLDYGNEVFLSFESAIESKTFVDIFNRGKLDRFFDWLLRRPSPVLIHPDVTVEKAPEPNDVHWLNISFELKEKKRRRRVTTIATVLLIVIGFALIILFNWAQLSAANSGQSAGVVQGLSILISILISVTNALLAFLIRQLADKELHSTFTSYNSSIAGKLSIAQFINTALTNFIAKLILSGANDANSQSSGLSKLNFYGSGGVMENMYFVFILNAFLTPLLIVLDPGYMVKVYLRRMLKKKGKNNTMKQKDANKLFENPQIDIALKYAVLMKTIWFTCMYATSLPFALIFQLAGLILCFFGDKYIFFNRIATPIVMGKELTEEMIESLEWGTVIFAAGNLLFTYPLETSPGVKSYINEGLLWATFIITVCQAFLPMGAINEKLFKIDDEATETFSHAVVKHCKFQTDYDLVNPMEGAKANKRKAFLKSMIILTDDEELLKKFEQKKRNLTMNDPRYYSRKTVDDIIAKSMDGETLNHEEEALINQIDEDLKKTVNHPLLRKIISETKIEDVMEEYAKNADSSIAKSREMSAMSNVAKKSAFDGITITDWAAGTQEAVDEDQITRVKKMFYDKSKLVEHKESQAKSPKTVANNRLRDMLKMF